MKKAWFTAFSQIMTYGIYVLIVKCDDTFNGI